MTKQITNERPRLRRALIFIARGFRVEAESGGPEATTWLEAARRIERYLGTLLSEPDEESDARALADVRALDSLLLPDTELIIRRGLNDEVMVYVVRPGTERDDAEMIASCAWEPDASRAKAAAWVREQSK